MCFVPALQRSCLCPLGAIRAAALLVLLLSPATSKAQFTSVREFMDQKAEWPAWAADERRVQLAGRFHGRTGDSFRLTKLEIPCKLVPPTKLPDRMRDGQRIELHGRLVDQDGRLQIMVSRLSVRETEPEQLTRLASEVSPDAPDELLQLAARFVADAEFYDDKSLRDEIHSVRGLAVTARRRLARGDLPALLKCRDEASDLKADAGLIDQLNFEILVTRWRQPNPDAAAILNELRTADNGWDRQVPEPPARLVQAFDRDPLAAYDSGSAEDRKALHGLLYQTIRLKELQSQLNPDGSNGMQLADLVRREFPAQVAIATALERREIDWRLSRVEQLSRQELQELYRLIRAGDLADRSPQLLEDWLGTQRKKFGDDTIGGLLRIADEYLFVAELSGSLMHRDQGIDRLKKAWQRATKDVPEDAGQIQERLQSLGWDRLNDQWITIEQMRQLPKDDVQLALREGRIVRGMTKEQVVQSLGQPSRISRLTSSAAVREIWIYDDPGDAGLIVRFKRPRKSPATAGAAVVEEVAQISQSARP
jgi:hypothetical protein